MEVNTHRIPANSCPVCGKTLDAASGGKEAPKPGDVTICAYCIEWLIFEWDLSVRQMTEDEIVALDDELFNKLSKWSMELAKIQWNKGGKP